MPGRPAAASRGVEPQRTYTQDTYAVVRHELVWQPTGPTRRVSAVAGNDRPADAWPARGNAMRGRGPYP